MHVQRGIHILKTQENTPIILYSNDYNILGMALGHAMWRTQQFCIREYLKALFKDWKNHRLSPDGAKGRSMLGCLNGHRIAVLNVLWKMQLSTPLPGASWPWLPLRGLEDCTCNNLRTLTEYLLQNLVHPGIPDCPFFSANKQAKGKGEKKP